MESNEDVIIGGGPNDKENEEEEDNKENVENGEEAVQEEPEPTPAAPRRIELLDSNSLNPLIYHYFSQGEYVECKSLIGECMIKYGGNCEFAFRLRGSIARMEGQLNESLEWFTKAYELSGHDQMYFYEIGRINFLLGNHATAAEQLEKASKISPNNPQVIYWLARAVYHLAPRKVDGKYINPVEMAKNLLMSSPHISIDVTLVCFLAKLLEELNRIDEAIGAYKKALKLQPDNSDVMIRLGLLYLRNKDVDSGFHQIGQCLAYDPTNSDAILAIGSIMQSYSDHDVALNKYRVASEVCDYNGCLWSNIGVGLMARDKLAAAHSALKKGAFINPLNFKVSYNLGVLHEAMSLNCSALHYMKLASELKADNPKIIGGMGVILSHMKDANNARKAYQKSLEIEKTPTVLLNYAIFEYHQGNMEAAWKAIQEFRTLEKAGLNCSLSHLSTAELLEKVLMKATDAPAIENQPHDEAVEAESA